MAATPVTHPSGPLDPYSPIGVGLAAGLGRPHSEVSIQISKSCTTSDHEVLQISNENWQRRLFITYSKHLVVALF